MSIKSDVLMWAQRVVGCKHNAAHQLLEIRADASIEDAQAAFHKIARISHPDLHRNALTADELELVTQAYSVLAGAYQTFRGQAMSTQRMKPLRPDEIIGERAIPATPSGAAPAASAAASMAPKALVYYRKAELALKRGDLKSALLQLKMAIAADPQNAFLRTALAEVDAELRKGP